MDKKFGLNNIANNVSKKKKQNKKDNNNDDGFETDSFDTEIMNETYDTLSDSEKESDHEESDHEESDHEESDHEESDHEESDHEESEEEESEEEESEEEESEEDESLENSIHSIDKKDVKNLKMKINKYDSKIFDWREYIKHYPDLNKLNTKEKAWNHWINHGINENRTFFSTNINENNHIVKIDIIKNNENKGIENFDWHMYIKSYPDLTGFNKEKAWNHWINHGKKEKRKYFSLYDQTSEMGPIQEKKDSDLIGTLIEESNHDPIDFLNGISNKENKSEKHKKEDIENFNWRMYIKIYPDLCYLNNKEKAWKHWINHGKNEKRKYFSLDDHDIEEEYEKFPWKIYIKNYKDLKKINTKRDAWNHWINHGKKEKREIYDLYNKEVEDYKEIKKKENEKMKNDKKNDFFF